MSRSGARHLLARARGVADGDPSACVVCGPSPFPSVPGDGVRDSFSSFGDLLGTGDVICAGCASLLGGRPGDDPPPLRTANCLAVESAPAVYPKTSELHAILLDPPLAPFVLLWAESRKKHAFLAAEMSSAARIVIGHDAGPITYIPLRHHAALEAVEALVVAFPRSVVAAGSYGAASIAKFGARRWAALDAPVEPLRGSSLLDLMCAIVPRADAPAPATDEEPMTDPNDERAAEVLAAVAQASKIRATRGQDFWGGFFRHRVQRFARLPLASMLSRLMDACGTSPAAPATQDLVARVGSMPSADVRGIEQSIQSRPALCVALAFGKINRGPRPEAALNGGVPCADLSASF